MNIDFSNRLLYNEKFIPLLHNDKRYIFLLGGGGSGKSVFVSQKEIIKSFQIKDKIMGVRKVKDTIKDSIFAELKKRIQERKLEQFFEIKVSPLSIRNKLTWCEFIFRGIDDSEKIKSVEWVARIWIEEATELTREDFDQLDLRLRGKQNMQITCTFNPTDAEHFLNTDFWVNGNTETQSCLHTTYTDNRFIGAEYKKVFDRLLETNKNYYNIYALGKWGVLEGMIFDNWDIAEIPETAQLMWYWLDFWFTNDPTALVALYKQDNEIYLDELIYERWLTNQDIVSKLKEIGIDDNVTIWADSAEPKSIEEIYRNGYDIRAVEKWQDSIKYGIDIMKQYKIHITPRSVNGQKEIKKYVWDKDKNGKSLNRPIDAFNHFLDWSRYVSMMTLQTENSLSFTIL